MTETLHFEVVGRLWNGARAAYQYSKPGAGNLTRREARSIRDRLIAGERREAGFADVGADFAALDDCRIVQVSTTYEARRGLYRREECARTLAGFAESASAKAYARAYGRGA